MSRATVIALVISFAAVSSAATALIINFRDTGKPALTEEQRAPREKFFGTDKALPPTKDGQEKRPRW
ncbi:entry exclusion protein TrbK [Ensifer sp. NM-2]|uniref:entry exclusion protein TrbK n=1 Tax=Ensifer sp. NM-2 TaxID=2109730 RepID=UPI000D11AD53|nr:entry exclusion protein TrbK [Ensifer sp. NM-2]PSS59963.1 entry exclusion protein TrbK [Ensifer sp. NM-2]